MPTRRYDVVHVYWEVGTVEIRQSERKHWPQEPLLTAFVSGKSANELPGALLRNQALHLRASTSLTDSILEFLTLATDLQSASCKTSLQKQIRKPIGS
jgi:hypothetical protein